MTGLTALYLLFLHQALKRHSVCIHQCSYGEINIIHILNPLAVGKQFVDQGQGIGSGDQINSIVHITSGFSHFFHK